MCTVTERLWEPKGGGRPTRQTLNHRNSRPSSVATIAGIRPPTLVLVPPRRHRSFPLAELLVYTSREPRVAGVSGRKSFGQP